MGSTQSSNFLDRARPSSRPSSVSSSQYLDQQQAKRAPSTSTLDSGHGSVRTPRPPSSNSNDAKGKEKGKESVNLKSCFTGLFHPFPIAFQLWICVVVTLSFNAKMDLANSECSLKTRDSQKWP